MAHGLPDRVIRPQRGERPVYSAHAVDQMFARRLPPPFVEPVLANPANETPGRATKPGRRVFEGVSHGRKVRAIIVAGTQPPLVVTVVDLGRG